jgi:8-oxo-dGTP diphosphatase
VRHLELGPAPAAGARVVRRAAVKAVVERDGLLLLLVTPANGDHKLPGGGVEEGETPAQALARELVEETGRRLVGLGPAVLRVVERRPDAVDPGAVFEMTSTYYRAAVSDELDPTDLDPYEAELGLTAAWVAPGDALRADEELLATGAAPPWTARECEVLRLLLAGTL